LQSYQYEDVWKSDKVIPQQQSRYSYKKAALLLILALTIVKAIVAFTMELGADESYYWLYSQHLRSNYFDHPPMVAIWVRIFTANLSLQNSEGFIRLGSLIGCAISSWFIFKTGSVLHSEKAGFFGVCLYNVSFYAAVTAGLLIMPDSPQMVFYTLCLLMIARISVNENSWSSWLLLGAAAGLCIMSKVHGVFIWVGLSTYTLFFKRSWLLKPQMWAALLLSLIITSPILLWNIKYDFITYRFHSDRVTIDGNGVNISSFFKELLSQVFFNNPFNVLLTITALVVYAKRKTVRNEALAIYNLIGLPLAIVLLIISLFRDTTLPHWSGPGYVALIPIAAIHLAKRNNDVLFPNIIKAGIVGFLLFIAGWMLVLYCYPGTYGSNNNIDLGRGDVTIEKYGRKEAGKAFANLYQQEVSKGIMPANAPVVYYKWWAAHIEYYFCRPYGINMISLGDIGDIRQYMWINNERKDKVNFSNAYCITPSDDIDDVMAHYSPYYSRIEQVNVIKNYRGGKPVRNFFIYRLSGWKNNLPTLDQLVKK